MSSKYYFERLGYNIKILQKYIITKQESLYQILDTIISNGFDVHIKLHKMRTEKLKVRTKTDCNKLKFFN